MNDEPISPQPKDPPRLFTTIRDRLDAVKAQRLVNATVAARDGRRCRCCGRAGNYGAPDLDKNLHRHHLTYRSRGGGDTTGNLVTLCGRCHALIHARQLHVVGTDADARLEFEIDEAACLDVFGTKPLPPHVHIVAARR